MKNFLILFLIIVGIGSCSKQSTDYDTLNGPEFLFSSSMVCGFGTGGVYNGITVVNGMLSFQDIEHFQNTLTCLEMKLDAHHENFDSLYGHLSLEEIEAIEDSIGFSDWQPLEDFESTLSFTSRRSIIEDAILDWEASSIQDEDDYPDDWDGWGEEFRTLLNADMQVKIGDTTYTFDMLSDSTSFGDASTREDCKWYARCRNIVEYTQGRRVRLKTTMYSGFVLRKVKGKVVHQRKKNGKWKRSRELISIHTTANTNDINCRPFTTMGCSKGQKKKRFRRCSDWNYDGVNVRWSANSVLTSTNIGNVPYGVSHLCW